MKIIKLLAEKVRKMLKIGCMKYLKKSLGIIKEKELEQLFQKIHDSFPAHLSLEDQGIFMVGYYHQVQKFYEKKSDSQEV